MWGRKVGYINTHDISKLKKYMHDFFVWGAPGGTENLWGARAPPPP